MMMQKFSLTKRPAETGGSINTRTEMHGKEKVPAHDIKIFGLLIAGPELIDLTGCATAYDADYITDESGLVVPRYNCYAPRLLLHKFIGAAVQIWTPGGDLKFSGASLKDITTQEKTGGNTEIAFKLQVTSEREHLDVPGLLNQKIHIAIRSAELDAKPPENQPELPMQHSEHTPEEIAAAKREEEEATTSAIGRKIGRASRKRK
jgi:hypothetical protein